MRQTIMAAALAAAAGGSLLAGGAFTPAWADSSDDWARQRAEDRGGRGDDDRDRRGRQGRDDDRGRDDRGRDDDRDGRDPHGEDRADHRPRQGADDFVIPGGPYTRVDDPIPGPIVDGAIEVGLRTVVGAGSGLTAPNWGTFAPGQKDLLYVVDQAGPLWAVDTRSGAKSLCLTTRDLLVPLGIVPGQVAYDERGFLGAAFHPDFRKNGLLYTYTSEQCRPGSACAPADILGTATGRPNHRSVIREWRLKQVESGQVGRASEAAANGRASPGICAAEMVREVYSFEQPQFNHNGGAIFFGTHPRDRRYLYITSGDGGCADDQDGQQGCRGHSGATQQVPNRDGNGQDLATPLGKILRIDPSRRDWPGFDASDIFAYGFRNPFRASSDRHDLGGTGGIWTGDAGQNHIEEIDGPIVKGGNYGWHLKEGTWLFNPAGYGGAGGGSDGFVFQDSPARPRDMIDPVAQYDHGEGVAVVGGFVYRGREIRALRGRYVFGDYAQRTGAVSRGRVLYVDPDFRPNPAQATPGIRALVKGGALDGLFVHGFGEDADGELYVLASRTGTPSGNTGVILKIVRP